MSKACIALDGSACEAYEWVKQRPVWPEGKGVDCRIALLTPERTFFFTGEDAAEAAAFLGAVQTFCS